MSVINRAYVELVEARRESPESPSAEAPLPSAGGVQSAHVRVYMGAGGITYRNGSVTCCSGVAASVEDDSAEVSEVVFVRELVSPSKNLRNASASVSS
eukprot:9482690-Pyramimonas_sp.AAC.1